MILLDEQEKFQLAEEKAKEAMGIFPGKSDFHFHLANIYGKTKQYHLAEIFYGKAINMSPKNPFYYTNFGVLYHREKKFEKTIEMYKKALQIDPNHRSARSNLNILMDKTRNHKQAEYSSTIEVCNLKEAYISFFAPTQPS